MENRKKFYANYGSRQQTGAWGKDTLQNRYNHVCEALDAYKSGILDDMDLTFAIKNAFVSKVYVSCGVVKAYPSALPGFGSLSGLYNRIVKSGVLDLQAPNPPSSALHCEYLNICELGTIVNPLVKSGKLQTRVYIEHVVPGKVYMEHVKQLLKSNKWNIGEFKKIFDVVSVCLVTDKENSELEKKVGRSKLPNNIVFLKDPFDPFARYKAAGVKIWKQCNQPCPGAANCPYMKTP